VMGGATISAFAATLASATAAARLAFSFASDGWLPERLARVDVASGTPAFAYLGILAIGAVLAGAFALGHVSGTDTFGACGTVGVLALVLIYGAVQVAALRLFFARWNIWQRLVPFVAIASLAATFAVNVFPIPSGIAVAYPYLVLAWLALGVLVLRDRVKVA